jgi:peroxiredoxin
VASLAVQPSQQQAPPLEIGTKGPDFALPDLSGRERRLKEFLGKPLLVAFFSPTCSFCVSMAPRLGELSEEGARVLVISRGDPDENLRLAKDNKWHCDVLLDDKNQVTTAYRIAGTPTGYLLNADGHVASGLMVGADALLALVNLHTNPEGGELTAESLQQKQRTATDRARQAGLALRESSINRQGLAPGAKAPEFTLSDLSGREHSLTSFLDKRVLLVFSDPNCGPCDALAPDLVHLVQRHQDNNLRVVMISRGDPDANRKKAEAHGFPFPVLLQREWEVSKEYAMFATPIAYLIEPGGVIAKPVAVGKKAILDLV